MTKKMKTFSHPRINIIEYKKEETKDLPYSQKESIKTKNIYNICVEIEKIIKQYKPQHINMEGISYGSVGSAALVDLSGLNFMFRQLFINNNIPFTIISPTENKKFAVGNGQAEKDVMVDAWKRLEPNIPDTSIKLDDLADAYFLSRYKSLI